MRWSAVRGAFALVGLMAAAVAVLELATEPDWRRADYPDGATARATGEVARRLIPAWVPDDAHSVQEVHNADTGMRWIVFKLDSGGVDALRATLEREGFRTVAGNSSTLSPVFRSRLGIVLPPERAASLQFLWKVPEGARYGDFVAIQPDLGQIFVWSQTL